MRLLIVGTLNGQLTTATKIAMDKGATVTHAADNAQAVAVLRSGRGADLLMVDVAIDIRNLVSCLEAEHIHAPIVACGTATDARAAVAAIHAGAKEYIPLPPDAELIAAVLAAVVAIDADIKRMVRASDACRRLMSIPGVGQLTALAFTAAVDDPRRFRRSRDIGAYLGLVPRRYQSGEVDYTGSISKCGDRRVRTLLYEAANVMLTRYKGPLKLKDWAFAIAKRSTMRKARIALARRLAIIMHAMLRHGTEFNPV